MYQSKLIFLFIYILAFLNIGQAQALKVESFGLIELKQSTQWVPADKTFMLAYNQSIRTFNHSAILYLEEGILILAEHSELKYAMSGFTLLKGKAYVEGLTSFSVDEKIIMLNGRTRIDKTDLSTRLANIEGKLRVLDQEGQDVTFGQGQQLIIEQNQLSVGAFFEHDPWYLNKETVSLNEASVLAFQGTAEVWMGDSWQPVELEQTLAAGHKLRTLTDSWLELKTDKNLIRLQANTELELVELKKLAVLMPISHENRESSLETRMLLNLVKGSVWLVVDAEDQNIQIITPGLIAGARGTTFRVIADSFDPSIKAFDGTVYGVAGFTSINIPALKQFGAQTGLTELIIDDIDRFNLAKDKDENALDQQYLGICNPIFNELGVFISCKEEP